MNDKKWRVTHGENFVSIEHVYTGRSTVLTPGSVYSINLSPDAVAALVGDLAIACVEVKHNENRD